MKKRITYLAIGVFVMGLASTAVGFYVRHRRHQSAQVTPFSMTSTQRYFRVGQNKPVLRATIKRFQRGDGTWKEITTYYSESGSAEGSAVTVGITDRGVYKVSDEKHKLFFLSPKYHSSHDVSADIMRQNGNFARDDVVLGYPVIVQRTPSGDETGYTEFYLAPSLGGTLLKQQVMHTDGSFSIIEAEEIKLAEPSDAEFGSLPDYPVDYAIYERMINDADRNGKSELASTMRKVLAEQKSRPR